MSELSEKARWLKRGRQRQAIARVLRQPLTASQLWQLARTHAPKLQLRDVWFLLRQMQAQGLVQCLNPSLLNGKVFYWTETGRECVAAALGQPVDMLPSNLNWRCVGKVTRAKVRRAVLEEFGRSTPPGRCISEIRRQLLDRHPMELNRTIRAVKELSAIKLVRSKGHAEKPRRKLYELTPAGRRVVKALTKAITAQSNFDL